jgi:hypothetical protein
MAVNQQPGWYPDPWAQAAYRWWDGAEWTAEMRGPSMPQPSPGQAPIAGAHAAPSPGPAGAHWLVLGGAVAVLLGSLLPWAEVTAPFVGTITVSGTDGDGLLTLLGAILVAGLGFATLRVRSRGPMIAALVVALSWRQSRSSTWSM